MNLINTVIIDLSIQQIRAALKDTCLNDNDGSGSYLMGNVFVNQMTAYINELNYSVNDCIKMLKKVNGIK